MKEVNVLKIQCANVLVVERDGLWLPVRLRVALESKAKKKRI